MRLPTNSHRHVSIPTAHGHLKQLEAGSKRRASTATRQDRAAVTPSARFHFCALRNGACSSRKLSLRAKDGSARAKKPCQDIERRSVYMGRRSVQFSAPLTRICEFEKYANARCRSRVPVGRTCACGWRVNRAREACAVIRVRSMQSAVVDQTVLWSTVGSRDRKQSRAAR